MIFSKKNAPDIEAISLGVRNGEVRSIARALSVVENYKELGERLINMLYRHTGNCSVVGITGPPGSGKSTLVDRLIEKERKNDRGVGVIAVDPSSPFSGGALLGDRLRMQSHATDPGVFIRSMASRGHLGGLSNAAFDAVKILDCAGFDTIIIETVGVGQSEIEIVEVSDIVILVLAPGMGDDIQAMKAGIMEIGDLFIVNKKDKDGSEKLKTEIEYALSLKDGNKNDYGKKVIMTSAKSGDGINILYSSIFEYLSNAEISGSLSKRKLQNIKKEIERILSRKISEFITEKPDMSDKINSAVYEIFKKNMSAYEFVNNEIDLFKRS